MFPDATSAPPSAPPDAPASHSRARDRSRNGRKHPVRGTTISVKRLPLAELEAGRAAFPPAEHADVRRPRRRADCADVPRPCPFVSCRHHLYLDVSAKTGSIKVNFPDLEPHELAESCQLDVAERGGLTLERVGEIVNLTRERVRQLELQALARLGHSRSLAEIRELEGRDTKRRLPVVQEDDAGAIDSVDFDVDAFVDLEDD